MHLGAQYSQGDLLPDSHVLSQLDGWHRQDRYTSDSSSAGKTAAPTMISTFAAELDRYSFSHSSLHFIRLPRHRNYESRSARLSPDGLPALSESALDTTHSTRNCPTAIIALLTHGHPT
jgi:hypothetical protein